MPNLVSDEELPEANSLLQAVENLAWTIGPVLGGVLVAARGPDLAYWLNAATFLVSAALIARIPGAKLQAERSRAAATGTTWATASGSSSARGRS